MKITQQHLGWMKTIQLTLVFLGVTCGLLGVGTEIQGATSRLRVDPTGRYLLGQTSKPFFWLGDTAWLLCHKTNREDVNLYLQTRARQRFTVIQAVAVMAEERVGAGVLQPNAYNDLAFLEGSPARPNATPGNDPKNATEYDYWDHVDHVIDTAEAHDLVVALVPMFVAYRGDGFKYLNPTNAHAYGKFLGKRYRTKSNLLWVLGGDNPPDTETERTVWNLMAKGITEGVAGSEDYSQTLMTFHITATKSSSQWFHTAPWLDFNMVQTWSQYGQIYPMVHADYDLTPIKPCGLGEGAYENGPQYPTKPINAWVIRKQAYWSYFAGGYHTYGNTDTWNFGKYKDEATQDWKAALNSPGASHLTILRNFFASMEWWKFVPDQSIFASGAGSGDTLNAAMRSTDGDQIIVYLTNPTKVTLNLNKITAGSSVNATWFNPTNGEKESIGSFPTREPKPLSFSTPPGWEDALLLLAVATR
ncbi:MAG: glycoside hydrolase family 140 protein [Acidobacteria bacterium]|nr:glycoside hydrolase family 140 protein [Acidobacteriota bacterium]MCI0723848.1 glycoside hydrolase family 140 protein [Acidobacteriota bacterium]